MLIVPKYADNELTSVKHDGVVEFQMLDRHLLGSLMKCRGLCYGAEKVFYHLPFGKHNILYYLHPNTQRELLAFIDELREGKEFFIAHAELTVPIFDTFGGFDLLDKCKPYVYLENSIPSPTGYDFSVDTAWQIAERAGVGKVCDLTHLHCTEYLYGVSQTVPADCRYFHFAACLDEDGVRDKKRTHGKAHPSYGAVVDDMYYLKSHGAQLDDAMICTEISEDDYRNRPDMTTELGYLRQYIEATKGCG